MSGRRKDDKPLPRSSTPGPSGKKTTLNPFAPGGIFRPKTPKPESSRSIPNNISRTQTPPPSTDRGYYSCLHDESLDFYRNIPPLLGRSSTGLTSPSQDIQHGPQPHIVQPPGTLPVNEPFTSPGGPIRPRRQSEHGGRSHGRSDSHPYHNPTSRPPVPTLAEHLRSPVHERNTSALSSGHTGSVHHSRTSPTNMSTRPSQTRPNPATRASGTERTHAEPSGTRPRARATTLVSHPGTGCFQVHLPSQGAGPSSAAGPPTSSRSPEVILASSQILTRKPETSSHIHVFPGWEDTIYQLAEGQVRRYTPGSHSSAPSFEIEEYERILRSFRGHHLENRILSLKQLTVSHTWLTVEILDALNGLTNLRVLGLDHCQLKPPSDHLSWKDESKKLQQQVPRLDTLRIFDLDLESEEIEPGDAHEWGLANLISFLRRFCGPSMRTFDFSAPKLPIVHGTGYETSIEARWKDFYEVLRKCIPTSLIRLQVRSQTKHTARWLEMLLRHLSCLQVLILEDQGKVPHQALSLDPRWLPSITYFVGNLSNVPEMRSLKSLQCICIEISKKGDLYKDTLTNRQQTVGRLFHDLPDLRAVIFYVSQWDKVTTCNDVLPSLWDSTEVTGYEQGYDPQLWTRFVRKPPHEHPYWDRYPRTFTVVRRDVLVQYRAKTGSRALITGKEIDRCGDWVLREEPWVYNLMKQRQHDLNDIPTSLVWGLRSLQDPEGTEELRPIPVT